MYFETWLLVEIVRVSYMTWKCTESWSKENYIYFPRRWWSTRPVVWKSQDSRPRGLLIFLPGQASQVNKTAAASGPCVRQTKAVIPGCWALPVQGNACLSFSLPTTGSLTRLQGNKPPLKIIKAHHHLHHLSISTHRESPPISGMRWAEGNNKMQSNNREPSCTNNIEFARSI